MRTQQEKQRRWTTPAAAGQPGDADYGAWLAKDIAEGTAELDAGKGIAAEKVWRSLGLE